MRQIRIVTAVTLALALLSGATLATADPKKIKVKCDEGESINAALMDDAEELIIKIRGFCEEHVVIERDNVTLRGRNPASDGIEGPTDVPSYRALIDVDNAKIIRLENLTVRRSLSRGVEGTGSRSQVELANCRIVDNYSRGLQTQGFMDAEDTRIANNGQGLFNWIGASLSCTRCTIEQDDGLLALAFGIISLDDSSMSGGGFRAAWAVAGGRLWVTNTSLAGGSWIGASENGEIWWEGGEISGSFFADWKSLVTLIDVEQTANPYGNFIDQDSTVLLEGSTLIGDTFIAEFSNGSIKDNSTVGDLHCETGGDLWCDNTSNVTGSSDCRLCPQP